MAWVNPSPAVPFGRPRDPSHDATCLRAFGPCPDGWDEEVRRVVEIAQRLESLAGLGDQ